jgi:hypothetical protein
VSLVLKQKISTAGAWRGSELSHDESWIHYWSESACNALDDALRHVRKQGRELTHLRKADFPLDTLAPEMARLTEELETGRGFVLLRGLPVERYSEDDLRLIYYGIGMNLGQPVRQNPKGDLLGLVMNVGDLNDKHTRVYETNAHLPYHTDPSDVFGLLCVRRAKSGGLSSLVSAAAIYNELLEHHAEYLGLFYRTFYYAHMGEDMPSLTPLFSFHDGKLSCRYLRQYIELGHEIWGSPLSRVEVAALDRFDAIAQDPGIRLDMMLEPGDMQFANNYAVLHSRTRFEDFDEPARRRKLLRLWLKMPNARTLAPDFPGRNGFGMPNSEP